MSENEDLNPIRKGFRKQREYQVPSTTFGFSIKGVAEKTLFAVLFIVIIIAGVLVYNKLNPRIGSVSFFCFGEKDSQALGPCLSDFEYESIQRKGLLGVMVLGTNQNAERAQTTEVEQIAKVSSIFQPSVLYWEEDILRWAQQYELDPNLIAAVMQIESCGDPNAGSGAGALGLFQVMPYHFDSGEDSLNPEINAKGGLSYLQRSYELAQGDVTKAFAGYNGGHGVISQHPAYWPTETLRYAMWGTGIMLDISQGQGKSPTLQSWLASGGRGLCNTAQLALK